MTMTGFRSWAPVFLPVLSAVLFILAFPPFSWAGLSWVALLPLVYVVQILHASKPFLVGWLSGTLAYAGLLSWLLVTFQVAHVSMLLGTFCWIALAGYLGLYWGAWTWAIARAPASLLSVCYGAALWVGLEYLRTYLFSGFPWTLFADSQYLNLPLIQIASLTGVYGVSFLLVFVNLVWLASRRIVTGTILVVAIAVVAGSSRLHRDARAPTPASLPVAILQGSIDQYKKWDTAYVEEIESTYANLARAAGKSHPWMIVWPETSVPGYLLQDPPLWSWLSALIRETRTSHLVGAPVLHSSGAYNAAFSITADAEATGEYAKTHLVPFGEIVPWASVLGRYIHVLNDLGGFSAGRRSPVLQVGTVPVGVNICYEAIFPNLVRRSVASGAQVLVNLTNDGWYMRTAEPYQHLAPNVFRAVENNRWLIRADNTGISALIDPFGRLRAESPLFQPWIIKGDVEPRHDLTLYTRLGDWFAWLCLLFSVGYAGRFRRVLGSEK